MNAQMPTAPAQISIPDFSPSLAERTAAANDAAHRWLGVSLIVGAPLMVLTTLFGDRSSAHAVIPLLWLAGAILAFAARRLTLTLTSPHVGAGESAVSRALLFAGIALVGPLTLHGLVHPNLWAPNVWMHFGLSRHDDSFANWMAASFVLTGLSHLVFAALCALRGFTSARVAHDDDEAGQRGPRPGFVTIGVAASAAALPAVLFYGVWGLLPVVFVAATSAPLLRLLRALEARPGE